jgi:hypothetical protein
MDGRIQMPIYQWLQAKYSAKYVDTITEPGIDKLFFDSSKAAEIKSKVLISVNKHNSSVILVSKEEHMQQIKNAVSVIKSWKLSVKVAGAWINENWQVIEI